MLRNIDAPAAGASVMVWKSDLITSAAFSNNPTMNFALAGPGLPTELILIKAYLETTISTSSASATVTGLTVDVGVLADVTGYAADIVLATPAPAGRHASNTPVAALALTLQVNQTCSARFTATGPVPRLSTLTFAGRIVLLYHPLPTPG